MKRETKKKKNKKKILHRKIWYRKYKMLKYGQSMLKLQNLGHIKKQQ